MAKVFGINTKIRGKVGEYIYRQTRTGTVVSEAPVKPITPLRTQRQMSIRTQWANLGAIYKQFDSMLRRGFEALPPQMSVYNAFIQANLGVVKVYITKTMKLNGGAILAPYQITRGSLPSISMAVNSGNKLVSSVRLGSLTISSTTTVAQFSQAVIDNNPAFLEGDQLTFFHGIQSVDTVTRTPRATINGYKVVLNTADDTPLWDVVSQLGFSVTDNCLATSQQITNGVSRTPRWPPTRATPLSSPRSTVTVASTPPLSISSPNSTPPHPDCLAQSSVCSSEGAPSPSTADG